MRPGETNAAKREIIFPVFDLDGLPASGESGEGAVWTPIAGELQISFNEAAYANGTIANFTHLADGVYRYRFETSELPASTEGAIRLRCKDQTPVTGIRTQTIVTPIRYDVDDVLALLHHNAVIDNHTWDQDLLIGARVRVFADDTTALAATIGAADDADGELMRFAITSAEDVGLAGKPDRYFFVREK